MIEQTINDIESVLSKYTKPLVAFSGGKDGFVVAHMCNKIKPNINMICETSFYFPKQLANIQQTAARHNFNVHYTHTLPDEWLVKNSHVIFANDPKIRSFSFHSRQQRAVKTYAASLGADITIFGRRSDENHVPNKLYVTKHGTQYHPLRAWKEDDIWNYFKHINEPKPLVYTVRFGQLAGNAPFYSLRKRDNSYAECWDIINEIDTDKIFYNKFNRLCH